MKLKQTYEVKVFVDEEEINLFTFYMIKAANISDAERLAKTKFRNEICGGNPNRKLGTYVINNPDKYKNYVAPYLDEIKANM